MGGTANTAKRLIITELAHVQIQYPTPSPHTHISTCSYTHLCHLRLSQPSLTLICFEIDSPGVNPEWLGKTENGVKPTMNLLVVLYKHTHNSYHMNMTRPPSEVSVGV